MPKLRIILLMSAISIASVYYYYYYYYYTSNSSPKIVVNMSKPPSSPYKIITMNDREPYYQLATFNGVLPYADGDRAQGTVVKNLQLAEKCREDPALIVVDVGAFIGEFGLYAAACGCQVYMFEVQPNMVGLIETSIAVNNFSSSRVHIIKKAVSNLPSNSALTFNGDDGENTATNGSLHATTIRLDDVEWPEKSTILLLKIDVEGFELDALRSAEKLFGENRVQHLVFEYTAWWTDRGAQKDLLPYVENKLQPKKLYALHRERSEVFGPLDRGILDSFHENHVKRHLQTDIYATFVDTEIEAKPYNPESSLA